MEEGERFVIVRRSLFDGVLTLKETAVFLFILAGTGKGPGVYARAIAERFGWSQNTVAGILKRLFALERIERCTTRNRGAFEGTTYAVATTQKTAHGVAAHGKSTHTRINPKARTIPSAPISPFAEFAKEEAAESEKQGQRTDEGEPVARFADQTEGLIRGAVAGSAMEAPGGRNAPRPRMVLDGPEAPACASAVRFSESQLETLARVGGNVEDLFDRTMEAKGKMERRGKRLGSVAAYMISIAVEDFRRDNGVAMGVAQEVATGNKFQRAAAMADVAKSWLHQLEPQKPADNRFWERHKRASGYSLAATLRR